MSTVLSVARYAAIAVLLVLFLWIGNQQQQCLKEGPASIVHLELAPTVEKANAFLSLWRTHPLPSSTKCPGDWQAKLLTVQALDTWFILAYSPLFALLSWLAADYFHQSSRAGLARFGYVLAGLQPVAGALDFVENSAINRMIVRGSAFEPWPLVSTSVSSVKWLLIVLFLLYGVLAVLHWALKRAALVDPGRPRAG